MKFANILICWIILQNTSDLQQCWFKLVFIDSKEPKFYQLYFDRNLSTKKHKKKHNFHKFTGIFSLHHPGCTTVLITWRQCGTLGSPCIIYLWREQSVQPAKTLAVENREEWRECFPLLPPLFLPLPHTFPAQPGGVQVSEAAQCTETLCPTATKQYLPSPPLPSLTPLGCHAYHYITTHHFSHNRSHSGPPPNSWQWKN